jgi:hypothetical protein
VISAAAASLLWDAIGFKAKNLIDQQGGAEIRRAAGL